MFILNWKSGSMSAGMTEDTSIRTCSGHHKTHTATCVSTSAGKGYRKCNTISYFVCEWNVMYPVIITSEKDSLWSLQSMKITLKLYRMEQELERTIAQKTYSVKCFTAWTKPLKCINALKLLTIIIIIIIKFRLVQVN